MTDILRPDLTIARAIADNIFAGKDTVALSGTHPETTPEMVFVEGRRALLFAAAAVKTIDISKSPMTSDLLLSFERPVVEGKTFGATLIVAGTDKGKTVLAEHMLAELVQTDGAKVAFASLAESQSPLMGSIDHIISVAYQASLDGCSAIVIDSLRYMINNASGGLRAGGLARGIESIFTMIDRIAKALAIDIIATVNPSALDKAQEKEAVDQMYHMAMASVERSIRINESSKAGQVFQISTSEHFRSLGRLNKEGSYVIRLDDIGTSIQPTVETKQSKISFATLGGINIMNAGK